MNRSLLIFLGVGASSLAMLAGCQDRTVDRNPTAAPRDAGVDDRVDASVDRPVRALCVPRARRCLAENSPLFDECALDGSRFQRGECNDGEVCREGACVPFACTPGRPLCVGPTTSATCDDTGRAVDHVAECEGDRVCRGGACLDLCDQAAMARSYIGCRYTAHELPNYDQTAPFGIVVANTESLTHAVVRVTDAQSGEAAVLRERFTMTPSSLYEFAEPTELESTVFLADGTTSPIESSSFDLPPGASAVVLPQSADAYRVRSTRPVVAYQFSPYCCNFTATNDASLLLPIPTWTDRYRVVGYPAWLSEEGGAPLQAYIRIVAEDAADVTVTSPVALRKWASTEEASSQLDVSLEAGEWVTLRTDVSEAAFDGASADLSGTLVESTSPVGVFTGHPCTFVPQDQWACDHLEEAVLPAGTLGSRYVLSPVRRRSDEIDVKDVDTVREATYWRIVADADARITFDPPLAEVDALPSSTPATADCSASASSDGELTLAAGEVCEFGGTRPVAITSTAPLAVAGVISGHQSTGTRRYGNQAGDPSLFMLGPVEQFRRDYAFVNPPTFKRTYVTVTAREGMAVTVDGQSIPHDARLERREVALDGSSWEVFTVALEPGAHRMEAEEPFGIIVYAYDDYVSYAFTGGLDLLPKGAVRP